jgi:5-methyltetrahydrofolate--homocysteine methyltransferase
MLDSLCANKKLKAKGRVGIFPANSQGEDVLVFSPDAR